MSVHKGTCTTVANERGVEILGADEGYEFPVPESLIAALVRGITVSNIPVPADELPELDPENFWSSKP